MIPPHTPLIGQPSKQSKGTDKTTSPGAQGIVLSAITSEGTAHKGRKDAVKFHYRAKGQEGRASSHHTPGSGTPVYDPSDFDEDGQPLPEL